MRKQDATARGWLVASAALAITGLAACATTTLPASTATIYPERPGKVSVPGSSSQVTSTRTMPATFDELFDATHKAAFQRGLEIDYEDRKKGRLSGKGFWQMVCGGGPCAMTVTFAAYVDEVDRKPTTRLTLILDRHGFIGHGGEQKVANDLVIDVQKLLAAQR